MKTTLEGLWAAGDGIYGGNDHSHAATTGRYSGRKAAAYAKKVGDDAISRNQVDAEKSRVYGPLKREDGAYWKELLAGINKIMQAHCGNIKRDNLMKMGLTYLDDMQQAADDMLYAVNPHDLGNALSILDVLTSAKMIVHASIARKASSAILHFKRGEYPEVDPPEWNKFVTIKLEGNDVKVGELPLDYGTPYVENYEKYSKV
jgi:succinate dehydrogenase/fumarate reductase flavoprotein subunit